ncbi:hypothetical protein ACP70R_037530 [Stipagrostis hirtigluma subsp. patula]
MSPSKELYSTIRDASEKNGIRFREVARSARRKVEALWSFYESTNIKMEEVELQEENSRKAKQDAVKAQQGFVSMVKNFNQVIQNSKESNDKHAQIVCEEISLLAASAQDLQSRLTKLSADRDEALTIVEKGEISNIHEKDVALKERTYRSKLHASLITTSFSATSCMADCKTAPPDRHWPLKNQ